MKASDRKSPVPWQTVRAVLKRAGFVAGYIWQSRKEYSRGGRCTFAGYKNVSEGFFVNEDRDMGVVCVQHRMDFVREDDKPHIAQMIAQYQRALADAGIESFVNGFGYLTIAGRQAPPAGQDAIEQPEAGSSKGKRLTFTELVQIAQDKGMQLEKGGPDKRYRTGLILTTRRRTLVHCGSLREVEAAIRRIESAEASA